MSQAMRGQFQYFYIHNMCVLAFLVPRRFILAFAAQFLQLQRREPSAPQCLHTMIAKLIIESLQKFPDYEFLNLSNL